MTNYQNLETWQSAMQLTKEIYLVAKTFPKDELYALSSQIKRAAVSVAANIAEGMGRQSKKDTIHFLHISRGSFYELETLLKLAVMIELMDEIKYNELDPLLISTVKLLNGLIKYHENADLK